MQREDRLEGGSPGGWACRKAGSMKAVRELEDKRRISKGEMQKQMRGRGQEYSRIFFFMNIDLWIFKWLQSSFTIHSSVSEMYVPLPPTLLYLVMSVSL